MNKRLILRHKTTKEIIKKPIISTFIVLTMLCFVADVFAVEQLHIAFDPPLIPGGVTPMDDWFEQGMFFTGPHGFAQYDSGRSGCPDNSTAYLHFASGPSQTLTFKFIDSTPFTLTSVDLAEYSTFFAKHKTITLVCHKTDGTVETANFTVDGLIDGPGGILDFETFAFGPEFTEISYVEVPTTGYSMDNVVLAQLPGYETLIGLEITGPNNVEETTAAQYNTIAFFEGGNTLNVNSSAFWSLDPNIHASIDDNGVLRTEDINLPEDITIYALYNKGPVTLKAEMSVHISLHTPLIMHVPEEYDTIQAAIDQSIIGDLIIVHPGTYYENINFGGKNITLRSVKPTDPDIVASTIIDGNLNSSVVTFTGEESPNCVLSGFTITNGSGNPVFGGGICGNGTLATIEYNVISNNRVNPSWFPSSAFGGGLSNCDGTIRYNIISDNELHCDEGYAAGGGLYNCNGKIQNNVIVNNVASGLGICAGGGLYNCNGVIQNNSIIGNLATVGGGISCWDDSSPTITNCTITGNLAMHGGGIYCCYNANPTITNCTIASNSADEAGGIFCSSEMTITNSILWDNSPQQIIDQGTVSVAYSNIQDDWPGTGNIDVDPCFVSPGYWADATDPNIIVEPNAPNAIWIEGDYHLYPLSLCINAGDPNYVPEPNETDLDGNPRIIAGRIDMGAYESNHIESRLWILPRTINRHSRQRRIMTWLRLPEGIAKDDIDSNTPLLLYPGEIEPTRQYVFQRRRRGPKRTSIIAYFDKSDLMDVISNNGRMELKLVGRLKTGQYFYGSDTVRIITRRPPPRRPLRRR